MLDNLFCFHNQDLFLGLSRCRVQQVWFVFFFWKQSRCHPGFLVVALPEQSQGPPAISTLLLHNSRPHLPSTRPSISQPLHRPSHLLANHISASLLNIYSHLRHSFNSHRPTVFIVSCSSAILTRDPAAHTRQHPGNTLFSTMKPAKQTTTVVSPTPSSPSTGLQ